MKLPISHLIPGMKLSRPVYGLKGQMLLNRGVDLTLSYISGLQRNNVLAVTVKACRVSTIWKPSRSWRRTSVSGQWPPF